MPIPNPYESRPFKLANPSPNPKTLARPTARWAIEKIIIRLHGKTEKKNTVIVETSIHYLTGYLYKNIIINFQKFAF